MKQNQFTAHTYRGLEFPVNIVIVRTDYKKKKKNNPNKATRIQLESIPRDMFELISIKNDSQ